MSSIICSNTYWLSPSGRGMWRTLLSWHKTGCWVVLWCICWTCAADFFSRYVIFMIPFFLTSILSTRRHTITCSYAVLCEILMSCYPSLLPTSTLHHSSGCVVYLFRHLRRNWASKAQMSCPWSVEGNHYIVFSLCSFEYSFSNLDMGPIVQ